MVQHEFGVYRKAIALSGRPNRTNFAEPFDDARKHMIKRFIG
jgi:hypothetical protein